MKERGIPFTRNLVPEILEDRKTQTRRLMLPQPHPDVVSMKVNVYGNFEADIDPTRSDYEDIDVGQLNGIDEFICPYGGPGDLLYCKESFIVHSRYDGMSPSALRELKYLQQAVTYFADVYKGEKSTWMGRTRSGRFMPKRFARIWLEIVNVRVERLQDISLDDIKAEGVQIPLSASGMSLSRLTGKYPTADYLPKGFMLNANQAGKATQLWRAHFASLWDSLNAKRGYPFKDNPFVWAIEFKRIESPKGKR